MNRIQRMLSNEWTHVDRKCKRVCVPFSKEPSRKDVIGSTKLLADAHLLAQIDENCY